MTTHRRIGLSLAALAAVALLPSVAAGADAPSSPAPASTAAGSAVVDAADPADDLLQITVTRLHDEARVWFDGDSWALSVIRLSDGHLAAADGDRRHASLSAAKAVWVAVAVAEFGTAAVDQWAESIFVESDDGDASRVLSLWVGDPAGFGHPEGADAVNAAMWDLGMGHSYLHKWFDHNGESYGYHAASTGPSWYGMNVMSTSDLARFWSKVGDGEVLGPARRAVFLDWARLPRNESSGMISPRLPAAVAEAVAHKAGWSDVRIARIDGGLVTTATGAQYAMAISFHLPPGPDETDAWNTGAKYWARYASCEVYNQIEGTDHPCTTSDDPYEIRNHTTRPIGSLSAATATRGAVSVVGWALDRDAGADPIDVRITADGTLIGTITADELKTWVHDRHGLGNYHGFSGTLAAVLSPGTHEICAVGINDSGAGSNATLGCETVDVPIDHEPVGNLAGVTARKDLIRAWGYARDGDTAGPIKVTLTIDGAKLRNTWADRGDGGHGFKARTPIPLGPGDYEICAIARNHEGAGPDTPIGCETVIVPEDWPPSGTLSGVWVTPSEALIDVTVKGRAWDGDTTDPIEVRVRVDGVTVGSLLSDRGANNRKYYGTIIVALAPGEHQVCTKAVNHDGGAPSTLLGCETVEVPAADGAGERD